MPGRRDFMLATPIEAQDGVLITPDVPGLGITLDDDAVARTRVARIVATARGVEQT
jgi:L-alanine-DL-glutamate epimerase-like enolase superfamily enzyme